MRCESRGIDPDDVDRGCGFLTKTERQFLRGEWSPSGASPTQTQKQMKRHDIQTRTRHALADFALLQQRGSEVLKRGVVEMESDPAVFSDEVQSHIRAGLLKFAMGVYLDDEMLDEMEALLEGSVFEDEVVLDLLSSAQTGDVEALVKAIAGMVADVMEASDLSESDFRATFEEALTAG